MTLQQAIRKALESGNGEICRTAPRQGTGKIKVFKDYLDMWSFQKQAWLHWQPRLSDIMANDWEVVY